MAENEATQHLNKRKIKQPPSVPFVWEERPGIAKKDWKPLDSSVNPIPIKLIASVPFDWEEKPGTPLHRFSHPQVEPAPESMSAMFMALPPPPPPPPIYSPAYFNGCNSHNEGLDSCKEQEKEFGMDLEAFGFEIDDSFNSVPSLLANCLVASKAISTAVPVQKTYQADNSSDNLRSPSSPASETDSTSSYATGSSSLVGASFLECLFPLLPPNSGFLEKARYPNQQGSQAQTDFNGDSNNTVVIRRPPTLGELIMMSRRISYQRKAILLREHSMELLKEGTSRCSIFGQGIKVIEGLQWKKIQARLKF